MRKLIDVLLQLSEKGPKKGFEMSVVLENDTKNFKYSTPFLLHYSDYHKEKYLYQVDYISGNLEDPDLTAHIVILRKRGISLIGKPIYEVFQEVYEKLLEMKPSAKNFDPWAQFDFEGKCIALYSGEFDKIMIEQGENLEQHYDDRYLRYYKESKINYGNNMVLNFWIEDLKKEHERIKGLNNGVVSEIMYLNISSPYYMFIVEDPDGNTIEITGGYRE